MGDVSEHIASWEATGLIDAATATRLRESVAAEAPAGPAPSPATVTADGPRRASTVAGIFGPGVLVSEAFAYLGIAFLTAAFTGFFTARAQSASESGPIFALGTAIVTAVYTAMGAYLVRRDDRSRRAAGVAWSVAVVAAATTAWFVADTVLGSGSTWSPVVAALVGVGAAVVFRRAHPALLTQIALLGALTVLASSLLVALDGALFGASAAIVDLDGPSPDGAEVAGRAVLESLWWAAWAVGIALLGLREAGHRDDPAAGRRSALTRLWAGLMLVIGVAMALSRSGVMASGEYGRVIEPWIVDLVLVGLCVVLIERAFRRDSGAFLVAGALALIIALTDFNSTYLTSSIEAGLLVEGLILLAVGFGVSRLRSAMDHRAGQGPAASAPGSLAETGGGVDPA